MSEKIENRVTQKQFQELSKTENHILGAQFRLDDRQLRTQSGTVQGTNRNPDVENQETNDRRSKNNPRPELGSFVYRYHHPVDSDPDEVPGISEPLS